MSDNIVWGWLVVLYLWLAGIGGGAYITAYLVHTLSGGRHRNLLRMATYVSVPVFAVGLLALTFDLGRPERFWHLLASFRPTSVMWFGTYFLVIGTLIGAGLAVREGAERFNIQIPAVDLIERIITFLGFLAALIVIAYVGVLFAQTAQNLWQGTLLLPWLFIASALSTGIAALVLVLRFVPLNEPPALYTRLERLDVTFIIIELVLLAIFLVWLAVAGPAAQAALLALIGGSMGVIFWVGLVVIGLILPLVLEWRGMRQAATGALFLVTPILVLVGGLALRYVIVFAGQV